jgi:hypothetical protein
MAAAHIFRFSRRANTVKYVRRKRLFQDGNRAGAEHCVKEAPILHIFTGTITQANTYSFVRFRHCSFCYDFYCLLWFFFWHKLFVLFSCQWIVNKILRSKNDMLNFVWSNLIKIRQEMTISYRNMSVSSYKCLWV